MRNFNVALLVVVGIVAVIGVSNAMRQLSGKEPKVTVRNDSLDLGSKGLVAGFKKLNDDVLQLQKEVKELTAKQHSGAHILAMGSTVFKITEIHQKIMIDLSKNDKDYQVFVKKDLNTSKIFVCTQRVKPNEDERFYSSNVVRKNKIQFEIWIHEINAVKLDYEVSVDWVVVDSLSTNDESNAVSQVP